MLDINGQPVIEILLNRLTKSKTLDDVIVATTNNPSDDVLVNCVTELGFKTYRGAEMTFAALLSRSCARKRRRYCPNYSRLSIN